MLRITNLTNSPYALVDAKNKTVMLPARGHVDIEPHPQHINTYRTLGYFKLEDAKPARKSKEPDALERYRILTGKEPGKDWDNKRAEAELEKLK